MMDEVSLGTVLEQVVAVLREAYEGPAHDWSYFTDTRPNAGMFGTLTGVTAVTASTPVAATSVAAHVYHINFAMDAAVAWIRREWTPRNWAESWRVTAVSEEEWVELLGEMRRRYNALVDSVATHSLETEEGIGGAIAAVAHAAYHLGAVRQKLAVLRAG